MASNKVILLLSFALIRCSLQEVCIVTGESSQKPPSCKTTTTLNQFCDGANIQSNTIVTFFSGTHSLNTTCQLKHISDISLKSQMGSSVTVQCSMEESSGIQCLDVSRVLISGIEFRGCGASWKLSEASSLFPGHVFWAALLFINGTDHTLSNLTVLHSKSSGIFIYNVAGTVTVNSCKALNTSIDIGIGNAIMYDTLATEDIRLTIADSLILNNQYEADYCLPVSSGLAVFLNRSKLIFDIVNTTFIGNSACQFGGNMAINFYDSSASVTISHSTFKEGQAGSGGGLYVYIESILLSSTLSIVNSTFANNQATSNNFGQTGNGGGLYVSLPPIMRSSTLSIVNSTFTNNKARFHGGGVFVTWELSPLTNATLYMDVINSSFSGNVIAGLSDKAGGGHALQAKANKVIIRYESLLSVPRFYVNLSISMCSFISHFSTPLSNSKWVKMQSSVILLDHMPIIRINGIVVESNGYTGIMAIKSNIEFSGSSSISNNTGYSGGGLQLTDSQLYFKPYTNLVITNNSAQTTGGGLNIFGPSCVTANDGCFYGLSSEFEDNSFLIQTVNFTIKDNCAPEGGDNFFGDLTNCLKEFRLLSMLHIPDNSVSNPSSISSSPLRVCFGALIKPNECESIEEIEVYPGEQVTISLYVVGQSYGAYAGTISASAVGRASFADNERLQRIGRSGGKATYTISKNSSFATKSLISLEPAELVCPLNAADTATIDLNFLNCPFGFNLTLATGIDGYKRFDCMCGLNSVILNYSINSRVITKRKFSWLGMFILNNHSYVAANNYCPFEYCNPAFQDIKSYPDHLYQDEQCQYNRTGVLCGSCPDGWSEVLGSSECRECSSVWLLLILPFALAGLLLVVVIHFLNLTVTMGTVSGLVFYANVMQDYSVVLLSKYHPIPGLTPFLQVFLSWLNLDLGISTCFYDGMEAFGKTIFLFVFPIYIWLISAIIILLSNRFIFFTRLMGENAVKVLSTLILLSYSKMLRVTIGILNVKFLAVYIDSVSSKTMARWAIDGNIPYLDPEKHLALFVIALLIILLLLPFSLILLCIKHVYYLSNYGRVFSWIDKLKPVFETFTGPFKDEARFWTGLLLFARLFLLVVNTLDYNSNRVLPFYIIISVYLLLLLVMIILQGVYKRHYLNLLECFFILNACLVFLINTYNGGSDYWISILSHLLVSSVFLVFLGIVSYHSYIKLSHLGFMKCPRFRPQLNAEADEEVNYEGMRGFEPPQQGVQDYKPLTAIAN